MRAPLQPHGDRAGRRAGRERTWAAAVRSASRASSGRSSATAPRSARSAGGSGSTPAISAACSDRSRRRSSSSSRRAAADGRVRTAKLTVRGRPRAQGGRSPVERPRRVDPRRPRRRPAAAAHRCGEDEVEQLLRASEVVITVDDPAGADARWCIEQYFATLGERFEDGFDPRISIAATEDELTPPHRALARRTAPRRAGRLRRAQAPRRRTDGDQAHVGGAGGSRSRPRPPAAAASWRRTRGRPASRSSGSRRTGR